MGEKLAFRISTGLKDIIGRELITDDSIAIFELVKNAYDADAKNVKIIFKDLGKRKDARIIIVDDGHGMSRKDLEEKWLFVGFSDKKPSMEKKTDNFRNKLSREKRRVFAGAKGIGRFSADRLGAKLAMYTKKLSEKTIHKLDVDWEDFEEDQKEQFQDIHAEYSVANPPFSNYSMHKKKQGTVVEIYELRSKWDRDQLLRLRRYLQRLVNPSHDPDDKFTIEMQAEEYINDEDEKDERKAVNGIIKNVVLEKLQIKTTQIDCKLKDGKIVTRLTDKSEFVFELEESNPYSELTHVDIVASFLNKQAKKAFTDIMGIQPVKYGSIFLYKNGFRIHPYGDEGDDWLGLERRKSQGYRRFLAARELIGRIEAYAPPSQLKEVSSRGGGVTESRAFTQLKSLFIDKVLRRLEKYVVEGIHWDSEVPKEKMSPGETKAASLSLIQQISGQIKDPGKNIKFNLSFLDILKERQIENLPEIVEGLREIAKHVPKGEREQIISKVAAAKGLIEELTKEKAQKERELEIRKKESLFLQKALSLDKDAVININHTIENSTMTITSNISEINKKIANGDPIDSIVPFVDRISIENNKIIVLAGVISSANLNTLAEKTTKDIVLYIKEYIQLTQRADNEDFQVRLMNPDSNHITEFSPLEIAIVIDNFITNAKKAEAGVLTLSFEKRANKLHVLVADDGNGVSSEDQKYLFTRGFTTTFGSGLGLYNIKGILQNMDGEAKFIGNNYNKLGKGACFEMVIK